MWKKTFFSQKCWSKSSKIIDSGHIIILILVIDFFRVQSVFALQPCSTTKQKLQPAFSRLILQILSLSWLWPYKSEGQHVNPRRTGRHPEHSILIESVSEFHNLVTVETIQNDQWQDWEDSQLDQCLLRYDWEQLSNRDFTGSQWRKIHQILKKQQ